MTSVLRRKRSLSQLVNQDGEQGDNAVGTLEPQKVDNDAEEPSELTTPTDTSRSNSKKEPTRTTESAFLAYHTLSNARPASVAFQQPSQLISFSYTPAHVQEFTDSALRYFVDPPSGANLSYGYDQWTRRPDERGRIDSLLRAISRVKRDMKSKGSMFPEIGIISWRGVMTRCAFCVYKDEILFVDILSAYVNRILTAAYETRDELELNVMSVKGTLYFEEHLTEERLREK